MANLSIYSIALLLLTPSFLLLASNENEEKSFAVAPIISSNPSMGTGVGVTGSYLYNVGEENPRSQLFGLAQYTDTGSYTIGARNMMHFDDGNQRAMTAAWLLHINNDFSNAEFVSESYGLFHRQSWKVADNWFAGIHGIAMFNNYPPDNEAGKEFLDLTGASDNGVYGVGLNVTYDSRDSFYYPMQGALFEVSTFSYQDSLGSDEDYDRYVNDEAPYSGESYLGRRSALRGFNAGEISGQRLSAIQAEYRYHISEKWKIVGFAGVGARYALQPKDKVHLRFDIAVGNDDNQGFYIGLQEAF